MGLHINSTPLQGLFTFHVYTFQLGNQFFKVTLIKINISSAVTSGETAVTATIAYTCVENNYYIKAALIVQKPREPVKIIMFFSDTSQL